MHVTVISRSAASGGAIAAVFRATDRIITLIDGQSYYYILLLKTGDVLCFLESTFQAAGPANVQPFLHYKRECVIIPSARNLKS